MSRVRSLIGKIGQERGRINENKFFSAFSQGVPLPEWLYRIERASREEDYRGIDAIAHTDVGKIFVQIKSSYRAIRYFQIRRQRERLAVAFVVVNAYDSPEEIRQKGLNATSEARERILQKRAR
ncbi:MAG TPA: hypothetical protein VJC12_01685 [Candidatus Paceibacterota bacterium]